MSVSHTVQDRSSGHAGVGTRISGNDRTRLNGFQSGLNFTGALVPLGWFFAQAPLNNCPEAGGHRRAKRVRNFTQDGRANLKASASFKRQASRGRFIKDNSKRPYITAMLGLFATEDFGRHIQQSAAYAGGAF